MAAEKYNVIMWLLFACLCALFKLGQGGLVGGITQIDKEDLKDYADLQEGISKFQKMMSEKDNVQYAVLPDTIEASIQVVQGALYRVKLKIGPEQNVVEGCSSAGCVVEGAKPCTFKVWSRVWLTAPEERLKIVDNNCQ